MPSNAMPVPLPVPSMVKLDSKDPAPNCKPFCPLSTTTVGAGDPCPTMLTFGNTAIGYSSPAVLFSV